MAGHQKIVEILGIDEVWIRVMATEIRQGHEIDDAAFGRTEAALEDFLGIRPGHRMHGVELHLEAAFYHGADGGEIEQAFHQFSIIGHRIEDDHLGIADLACADLVDIDIGCICNFILVDHL